MTGVRDGAAIAMHRLRHPRAAVAPAAAAVFVVVAALLERSLGSARATDHALTGATFGVALPLLAYVTLVRVTGRTRLDTALWEVARHGGSRRAGAAGLVAASAVWLAGCGAVLAALTVLVTRGPSDPELVRDVLASSWLGLLGGLCYACWFGLGSAFGAAGGGRTVALLVDWLLGSSATALAVPWPRGHLRNLLGAEPIFAMPQWSALVAVAALAIGCAALTVWRTPR